MTNTKTIAVLGAGTMGNGIAHVCARSGFNVLLYDVDQSALYRGLDTIRTNVAREVAKEKLTQQQADEARSRITLTTRLDDLAPSTFVIEAATERFAIKAEIFRDLDRIIRGLATSQTTFDTVHAVSVQLGKTPVEVNDAAGFISNRVLMPLINEAIYSVMEGVATPEAVDQVFVLGMAHPMGPLTLADFIGLDVCADIMRVLAEGLGSPKYNPCPLLVRMVDAGWLGRKSGRGFYTYPRG
jgi:3-hydroxybutyryl-CoA dehydrogenase